VLSSPGGWPDPERVSEYLAREVPHRPLAETMLLAALPSRVERVLDLGTGDGRLIDLVAAGFADAECHFKWLQLTLVVGTAR
jgi:tRNA (cmo5U34)-methyltransferase